MNSLKKIKEVNIFDEKTHPFPLGEMSFPICAAYAEKAHSINVMETCGEIMRRKRNNAPTRIGDRGKEEF